MSYAFNFCFYFVLKKNSSDNMYFMANMAVNK